MGRDSFLDEVYQSRKTCVECGGKLEVEGLAYPYCHVVVICQNEACGLVDEEIEWEIPDDPRYW